MAANFSTRRRFAGLASVALRATAALVVSANTFQVAAHARPAGIFQGFAPDGSSRIQADGSFVRTTTGGRINLKIRVGARIPYQVHDAYDETTGTVSVSLHGSRLIIDEVWTDASVDHRSRTTREVKEIFTLSHSSCTWDEIVDATAVIAHGQCPPFMTNGLVFRY
jgi:hypothetical protein